MSRQLVVKKNWRVNSHKRKNKGSTSLMPTVSAKPSLPTSTVVENRGPMVQLQPGVELVKIDGTDFEVDAAQLIRMVRQVTQTIGEYKRVENAYGSYVIPALRKARSDIVSDLENTFGVHWEIDKSTGQSIFFK